MLDVEVATLDLIAELKALMPAVRKHDRDLARQLLRAANSIALNLSEAQKNDAGTGRARYASGAGSANETRMAVRVALAWGYFAPARAEIALKLLDRIVAMLWKLSRAR